MALIGRISMTTLLLIIMATLVSASPPVFLKDVYPAELMEDDANVPVYVTTVSAYDPDGDTDIWYSLQNTADHYFSIDPRTGAIEAIKPLDREDIPRYHLVVMATDNWGNGETGLADVVVELNDINDNAPIFPYQPYIGMVMENSPVGTSVMRVLAEDHDDINSGDNAHIVYSIHQNARWNLTEDIFAIDEATGDVSILVSELDRERMAEYEIVVKAIDGAGHMATSTATIIIGDDNDNAPEFSFSWYSTVVHENTDIGSTLYRMTATDNDADFDLTFNILDGNDNDTFSIMTSANRKEAMIMLNQDIDYENPWQPKQYNLTLEVSDGMHTDMAFLWILVADVNENAPVFDPSGLYEASCLENVTVGTVLATVSALDDDGDDLRYMIDPTTDPLGQFHIDEHSGVLSTADVLDRETMEHHNLTIVAYDLGEPHLSTSTEFIVTVEDVNDNGPVLAEHYMPMVHENVAPPVHVIVVSAVDADGEGNREPFTYTVDNSNGILDYFDFVQVGDEANITTKVDFDREEQDFYHMHIVISDIHGMSATSTLTIEIGDVNDNPHSAGIKEITVFQYNGRGSRVIGHVFAPDPDIVDDKYYDLINDSQYFEVNSSTGAITIMDKTPEGMYEFDVSVQVRDVMAPLTQISKVTIEVWYIFDTEIAQSASLRLSGVSPEDFIMIPPSRVNSKMQNFTQSLANIMSIDAEEIVVFNVAAATQPMMTDVHYYVMGYKPEVLDATVATNRAQIEQEAGIMIAMVNINECVDEHACNHGSCTTVFQIDEDMDALVDGGSAALSLSVMPHTTAECMCLGTTCQLRSCDPNPCHNGGLCMPSGHTYQCDCPNGFTGPQCQDVSRSFSGDGYAWYEALEASCLSSSTSLEFLTTSPDGTLLYNGPLSTLTVMEPTDYIALVLKDGHVHLEIDLGSGPMGLHIPDSPRLDDGYWHHVEVYTQDGEVNLMVDHCKTSVIEEYPTYTNEDTTSCLASAASSGHNIILNVNQPLQVGGVSHDTGFMYPTNVSLTAGFDGCIRNIMQDTKVYDLGMTAHEVNTARGCEATDAWCMVAGQQGEEEPLCMHGVCMADLTSVHCVCDAGYHGERCENETHSYDFGSESYVSYSLSDTLDLEARQSDYQIMFRTRETDGVIWQISAPLTRDGKEFIHIRLVASHVTVFYDLGGGEHILTLDTVTVNDGAWHTIHLLRQRHHMAVSLDNGGDACHWAESRDGTFKEIDIEKDSLFIGAMVDEASGTVDLNYIGCLNDPRINNVYIGFGGQIDDTVGTPSDGVSEYCTSPDACENVQCTSPLQCQDLWRKHECSCEDGEEYIAPHNGTVGQCLEIDDCLNDPCLNGATCQDGLDSFTCQCPEGFHGHLCEYTSLCTSDPCQNGATCHDSLREFHCHCAPGFFGDLCDDYDECYDEPCQNGGSCTDGDNSHTCDCPEEFWGDNCERVNACAEDPCQNGATCNRLGDQYSCSCSVGFFGDECENYDFCISEPCQNRGNCSLTYFFFSPVGYECACELGFEGTDCEKDNYCLPNPCQNKGVCIEIGEGDGYVCECDWSYGGDTCEDFEYILVKITLGVTLFGTAIVIILLVVAICCANRYQKKEKMNTNLPMYKTDTEMSVLDGNRSATKSSVAVDDTVMNAGVYKASNEYDNVPVPADEDRGTNNVAYVHADENGYDSVSKKPPSENNSTSDEGYDQGNGADSGSNSDGGSGLPDHDKITEARD